MREKGDLAHGIPSVCCLLWSFHMTRVEWESDLYLGVIWPAFKGGRVLKPLCKARLARSSLRFHAHSLHWLFKEMCESAVDAKPNLFCRSPLVLFWWKVQQVSIRVSTLISGWGWRDLLKTSRRTFLSGKWIFSPHMGNWVPAALVLWTL